MENIVDHNTLGTVVKLETCTESGAALCLNVKMGNSPDFQSVRMQCPKRVQKLVEIRAAEVEQ